MSLPDEDILIQQLRDEKTRSNAFSSLVKTYSETLYWHIRRMVLSHDDTNDILQNTFINKNSNAIFEDIDTATTAVEADEWFDGDDLQARLQAAIQTLPPKQRMVFNMKYYEEMKYEEMSTILGTSVGALKASYHIAVKKISEYFDCEN